MKKVAILMSSYDGDKYIRSQIDSLLQQKEVEVVIFVRDDGSTDDTLDILRTYEESGLVTIVRNPESNIGVGSSFMELVYHVGDNFDFYAFCDQDDIWLEDKLSRAIGHIELQDTPILYCSNQLLVNEKLDSLGWRHKDRLNVSYLQILNANKISGCTMVWNKSLQRQLIREECKPSSKLLSIRIHDVWVAMVASVIGQIIYDEDSKILYRQHENNVVGVKEKNLFKGWIEKFSSGKLRGRSLLAAEILESFSEQLSVEDKKSLERIAYYRKGMRQKLELLRNLELLSFSQESRGVIVLKVITNFI